ncbi:Ornithine/acetylornithine aminotransferase [Weeksella virosa]|uniref:helicase HerA-like domain-containing protein n=1 Tax=Weeksella virosa TaxID=1014 RepID=UPI000DFFB4D7|nr:helicase HerA-like domain-containing protein [Weeksella virosa]SUP54446.1 Ornithine/acetylornithine aminotransferase [Weeksella virosa]
MSNREAFIQEIQSRYQYNGDKIILGKAKLDGEVVPEAEISIALKTMNRHGLIGGATGTGKTKSLQIIAEQLSEKGVPTLLMDIKGDLSGIAAKGDEHNQAILQRHEVLGLPYVAKAAPSELLSISDEPGVKLRATIEEFGPVLFSKILELNETQSSIISIIFKYCEDNNLPLIDLEDMRRVLQYVTDTPEGKTELNSNYGTISPASLGAILRKIVGLEQQGATKFFGEPSFDVQDLLQVNNGQGTVNIIRLTDIQNQPNLFSTFMLSLLNKIYSQFPEQGDSDRPKLVIFIDEAHLIFKEASKTLLNQIETMVKLIRSKGVGLFFVTQVPGDVPDGVLSQLGLKVQHALRGFTAKDRKEIQKAIENYPISTYYKADEVITQLGIGEAFVTALDEKGIPTPLAYTYMRSPNSRMDILTENEISQLVNNSKLVSKYQNSINRHSAHEMLSERLTEANAEKNAPKPIPATRRTTAPKQTSWTDSRMARDVSRTATRKLIDWGMKLLMSAMKGKK